jgi:DNA-binding CsgD family transcriptional regulator
MPSVPLRVDATTAAILHEAHYKIAALGRDRFAVYDCVRSTLSKIAGIDSFYVGLLQGPAKVRFPYGFEGGQFDDPALHTFGPNGQTAWLLKHRQTYRYSYDNGAVLHASVSFGDVRRRSADAVTVPLFRPVGDAAIFGMISMHSYTPATYGDEAVRAAEWLANVLARVLTREDEDESAIAQLGVYGEADQQVLTAHHVIDYLSTRLGDIRRAAEQCLVQRDVTLGAALDELRGVARQLEQLQSGLVEMARTTDSGPARRFLRLTKAEQAVAMLLCAEMTTEAMARELGVKPNTVKAHVKHILAKYGMAGRAEVAADVRRHLQ